MPKYLKNLLNKNATPQGMPIAGKAMVPNSDGAYVFGVDEFTRLRRFLILGSEGGSYYASEGKLTQENADAVLGAIAQDGLRVVDTVIEISRAGRAPRNSPALFVLALCMALGDTATKRAAGAALPQVARTGTHLFEWAGYVDSLRGWGKGLRRAVSNWYLEKPLGTLALHAVKYRQREGWTHHDLMHLCHVQAREQNLGRADEARNLVFAYMKSGWPSVGEAPHPIPELQVIWAAERAKTANEREMVELIRRYGLPMEAIPSDKRTKAVYEALIPGAGITWLIRNLGNLSRVGAIAKGRYGHLGTVTKRLTDPKEIRQGRVHPLHLLVALKVYGKGHGAKGGNAWPVIQDVVDALDEAFYLAFDAVQPAGARYMLAIDVSASMAWPSSQIGNLEGLYARDAAACMAMVTYRTEPKCLVTAFSGGHGTDAGIAEVALSRKMRLDDVVRTINALPAGYTNCALPMLHAAKRKMEVDAFVVLTDSETNAYNSVHPMLALREYRERMGLPAKLIVVGMVSNGFTIADPADGGALDVVGFDSAAPAVMTEFVAGRI